MRKSLITLVGLAAAAGITAAALTGCGTTASHPGAPASSPAAAAPAARTTQPASGGQADPAAIVKAAGAALNTSYTAGDKDIHGALLASGDYLDYEHVTVAVDKDAAAYRADLARTGTGDADHAVIAIPAQNAVMVVTAVEGSSGPVFSQTRRRSRSGPAGPSSAAASLRLSRRPPTRAATPPRSRPAARNRPTRSAAPAARLPSSSPASRSRPRVAP